MFDRCRGQIGIAAQRPPGGPLTQKIAIPRCCLLIGIVLTFMSPVGVDVLSRAEAQTSNHSAKNAAKLAGLKRERDALWNKLADLGGQATPKQAVDNVQYRMRTRLVQIDRLEEVLLKIAGSKKSLERMKNQTAESSVFGLDDFVGEVGEKAGEMATKKGLEAAAKKGAGKAVGWLGVIGDVVEYGGKKIIKEFNVDQLEKMIEQNSLNLRDAFRLRSALLHDNDGDRTLLDQLSALIRRYEQADDLYLSEKQRQEKSADENAALKDPEKIVDFCSYIPDSRARKGCYGVWRKQCVGVIATKHMKRCYATLDAARAGGGNGGKLWNFCAHMKANYKNACYNFGKMVKRLCQMIMGGPERAECLRNVASMPSHAALKD